VHPAKREIRFREEPKVRSFVIESLLTKNRELSSHHNIPVPEVRKEQDPDLGRMVPQIDPSAKAVYGKEASPQSSSFINLEAKPLAAKTESALAPVENFGPLTLEAEGNRKKVGARDSTHTIWRFLDRPHGDLAVFASVDGLIHFHARAAYERVRYEQLEDAFQDSKNTDSQSLLFPESLELDGIDQKNLMENMNALRLVGFVLEEFGRNFYRLEGCPKWVDPEEAIGFLRDFLEIARESGGGMDPEKFAKEALVQKATSENTYQKVFSDDEVIRLAETLLQCRNPYNCPKGKPTFYEIPKREIENRFRRNL